VTRLFPYSSYIAVVRGLAAKGELLAEVKVSIVKGTSNYLEFLISRNYGNKSQSYR
jgi:hypothetical protein